MATNILYNTLFIYYDPLIGKDSIYQAIEEYGASIIYDFININAIAIRIPTGTSIGNAMEFFKHVDGVLQVTTDHFYHIDNDY